MVVYDKRKYHKSCFRCDGCRCLLQTGQQVFKCNKFVLCKDCSDSKNNKCFSCKAKFKSKYLIVNGDCFHFPCFVCNGCNKNIGKNTYKFDETDQVYYHKECFNEIFDPPCDFCGQRVDETDEVEFNGSLLHSFCVDEYKAVALPIEEYLLNIGLV